MSGHAQALRALRELEGLDERRLREVSRLFDEVTVGAGTVVDVAGRPASQYAVVLAGALESTGPCGRQEIPAGASAGWTAMWNRSLAPATVTAVVPTRLLVMGRAQFRAMRALKDALTRPLPARAAGRAPAGGTRTA